MAVWGYLCVCVCANDRLGCGLLLLLPNPTVIPSFPMTSCQTSAFLPHRLGFPLLWRFCFTKSVPHSCLLECSLETTTSSQWMETAWSGVDSDFPHVYEYCLIIYLHFAYAFSNQALLPASIKSPVVITWLIVDCQRLLLMILSPQQLPSTFSLLKYLRIEKSNKIGGN